MQRPSRNNSRPSTAYNSRPVTRTTINSPDNSRPKRTTKKKRPLPLHRRQFSNFSNVINANASMPILNKKQPTTS